MLHTPQNSVILQYLNKNILTAQVCLDTISHIREITLFLISRKPLYVKHCTGRADEIERPREVAVQRPQNRNSKQVQQRE